MFSFFDKKATDFFNPNEKQRIIEAIQRAENNTSAVLKVYIENHCICKDPLLRASEIFKELGMAHTEGYRGVLLYIALKDRKLAIYAHKDVHERLGEAFWQSKVDRIASHFKKRRHATGIVTMICETGDALKGCYPHLKTSPKKGGLEDLALGFQ